MTKSAMVAAAMVAVTIGAAPACATTYKETFPRDASIASQDQNLRAPSVGWCGGNAGDQFCNNPPGTVANQGGEGAVSNTVVGPDGTKDGIGFWSQTGISDGFFYTDEFTFDVADLIGISWYQADSATGSPTRLAFLVDDVWYASGTTYSNQVNKTGGSVVASDWKQFSLTAAQFALLDFFTIGANVGGALPDGSASGPTTNLTSGEVTAFGFYWDSKRSGTSRFDDVTVNAIPLPMAGWLLIGGMATWFGAGRALRKAA